MADLFELQELLDYRTLTEAYVEAGREVAPANPFFDFYTGGERGQFQSDEVEFVKLSRVTDPAPVNYRGQPARVLQPVGKEKAKLSMLNAFDVVSLGMDAMQMLREPDNWVLQQRGRAEIGDQFDAFSVRHQLTKQVYMAKYMQGGAVYIDPNGEILESSSGAAVTISTGIPSSNLSQIAETNFGMGSGNIISAAWDVAGTKLLTQLDRLNEATERANSEPLRHVWLNRANKKWLRENTEILNFFGAGQERLDQALLGDSFEIQNFVFHFYGGTYTASDGTRKPFIPVDKAIITPEPTDGRWLANGDGLQLIPTSLDIKTSIDEAVGAWTDVWGDFAYFLNDHNPGGMKIYMGFNWLFGLRNPASVFVPTVDF